jgi:hypothetical protein
MTTFGLVLAKNHAQFNKDLTLLSRGYNWPGAKVFVSEDGAVKWSGQFSPAMQGPLFVLFLEQNKIVCLTLWQSCIL